MSLGVELEGRSCLIFSYICGNRFWRHLAKLDFAGCSGGGGGIAVAGGADSLEVCCGVIILLRNPRMAGASRK
jgi:hypothetical protein